MQLLQGHRGGDGCAQSTQPWPALISTAPQSQRARSAFASPLAPAAVGEHRTDDPCSEEAPSSQTCCCTAHSWLRLQQPCSCLSLCLSNTSYSEKSAQELGWVLCAINLPGLRTLTSFFVLSSALEHLDMPVVKMKSCLLDNLHLFRFLCLFCLAPFPNKEITHQCVRDSNPTAGCAQEVPDVRLPIRAAPGCASSEHPSPMGAHKPLQGELHCKVSTVRALGQSWKEGNERQSQHEGLCYTQRSFPCLSSCRAEPKAWPE